MCSFRWAAVGGISQPVSVCRFECEGELKLGLFMITVERCSSPKPAGGCSQVRRMEVYWQSVEEGEREQPRGMRGLDGVVDIHE
jgi:hypothetical protein